MTEHLSPWRGIAKLSPELFQEPSFESCEGKLGRGREHLDCLRDEIEPLLGDDAYSYIIEHDKQAGQYVFKVSGIKKTKTDWGYLAGDCIHNLRSALDHLIFQLSLVGNNARRLTEEEAGRCQFPICTSLDSFKGQKGRVALLRAGERTRIEELQPFHAWDMSIWGPDSAVIQASRPEAAKVPTLLRMLSRFDNIDKHRLVHPTWHACQWYVTSGIPEAPEGFSQFSYRTAALEDDTPVGAWGYAPGTKPDPPSQVDVKRYYPISIALGEASFVYGALDLLSWFADAVELVIDLFRPCIQFGGTALPVKDLDVPLSTYFENPPQ